MNKPKHNKCGYETVFWSDDKQEAFCVQCQEVFKIKGDKDE